MFSILIIFYFCSLAFGCLDDFGRDLYRYLLAERTNSPNGGEQTMFSV